MNSKEINKTIRRWLDTARPEHTHLLVVLHEPTGTIYPIYPTRNKPVLGVIVTYSSLINTKVMEVYSFALDLEHQLKQDRAWYPAI